MVGKIDRVGEKGFNYQKPVPKKTEPIVPTPSERRVEDEYAKHDKANWDGLPNLDKMEIDPELLRQSREEHRNKFE
ncbi:MAG: hypothetical protein V1826_02035 [bacterium]